jgi:hypothetical protein
MRGWTGNENRQSRVSFLCSVEGIFNYFQNQFNEPLSDETNPKRIPFAAPLPSVTTINQVLFFFLGCRNLRLTFGYSSPLEEVDH